MPRKIVVRLTDRPDMILDVYRGRKTTIQQQQHQRSDFCIYVFMLLFSFSIFSDRWSLKIENENNNTKILTAEAPSIGPESSKFTL